MSDESELESLSKELGSLRDELRAAHDKVDQIDAFNLRAEAREAKRLEIYEHEVQCVRLVREEQHKVYLEEVASLVAHRQRILEIEQEKVRHLAALVELLQAQETRREELIRAAGTVVAGQGSDR